MEKESKIGVDLPEPLIELCGPDDPDRIPARLPHETHLLDQPPYSWIRDDEQLVPVDLFATKDAWYAFFNLAITYPNISKYNKHYAKKNVQHLTHQGMFDPAYSSEHVLERAQQLHSALLKDYPFAIEYMKTYRKFYSWNMHPRIMPHMSKEFNVPSYAAYVFRRYQEKAQARFDGLAEELANLLGEPIASEEIEEGQFFKLRRIMNT